MRKQGLTPLLTLLLAATLAGCSAKAEQAGSEPAATLAASPSAPTENAEVHKGLIKELSGQSVTVYLPLTEVPDNGVSSGETEQTSDAANEGIRNARAGYGEETATFSVTNSTKIVSGLPAADSGSEPIDNASPAAGDMTLDKLQARDEIAYILIEGADETSEIRLLRRGQPLAVQPTPDAQPTPTTESAPMESATPSAAPSVGGQLPKDKQSPASQQEKSGATGKNAASTAKPSASAKPSGNGGGKTDGGASAAQSGTKPAANETMTVGKIKSISGTTITIYKSSMPARSEGGGAPSSKGEPQGSPPPTPSGDAAGASSKPSDGGKRGGGKGMTFSEETVQITVTDATKLASSTFSDGKRTESAIKLESLKAGDIVMVTLKEGTTEAETIRLNAE